jgi:hypothetical protein
MGKGWEGGGQFTSNLGKRWTDPVTSRKVPSKYREQERGAKGNQQGEIKARGTLCKYTVIYSCTY